MQDAQCAVACASLAPVIGWEGTALLMPMLSAEEHTAAVAQRFSSHALNIPTPPPDLV